MLMTKLSNLVENNNLTQSEFETITYKLSPQQERLFIRLTEVGKTDTSTLRVECSIGNISDVATRLNKKLEAHKDPRRVICTVQPNTNQFNEVGVIGHWFIVDAAANDNQA